MATVQIPRRPVLPSKAPPKTPSKSQSVRSESSSVYSESPGFAQRLSDSSGGTKDSLSGVDSEAGFTRPPPVPPKSSPPPQLPQSPQSSQSPKSVQASTPTPASPQVQVRSPPRGPEIWRRRSVKSDRSLSITDLKLVDSNGATDPTTTVTVQPPQQQPVPQRSLPPLPLKTSSSGRKPVPLRPAPPQPQPDLMGSKTSKLKNKAKNVSQDSSSDATATPTATPPQLPVVHLQSDQQQQSLTRSTRSQVLPSLPPLPPDPPSKPSNPTIPLPTKSVLRKDVPSTLNGVTNNNNNPNFLAPAVDSRKQNESLTIASDPAVKRSPQPRQPFATRILTPGSGPSSASEHAPSPLTFPGSGSGSSILLSPAPEGTVFLGPELNVVHLGCYHSHRLMRSTKNIMCPTACMICKKKDTEIRFRCTWCCVSACAPCMKVLSSTPGRDLKACVKKIGA